MHSGNTVISVLSTSKAHGPWVNSFHPQGAGTQLACAEVKKPDWSLTSGLWFGVLDGTVSPLSSICINPLILDRQDLEERPARRQKVGLCVAFAHMST